jgi:hypothetical protein
VSIYLASWQDPPTGWGNPDTAVFNPNIIKGTDSSGHIWYKSR